MSLSFISNCTAVKPGSSQPFFFNSPRWHFEIFIKLLHSLFTISTQSTKTQQFLMNTLNHRSLSEISAAFHPWLNRCYDFSFAFRQKNPQECFHSESVPFDKHYLTVVLCLSVPPSTLAPLKCLKWAWWGDASPPREGTSGVTVFHPIEHNLNSHTEGYGWVPSFAAERRASPQQRRQRSKCESCLFSEWL